MARREPIDCDWTIGPLGPAGAEVSGLDLREPFDLATESALRRALADHRLLVFRGQALSPSDQIRTLGVFGNVLDESRDGSRHTYVSGDDSNIKAGRLLFHSDNHFTERPLEYLSLYAESVDERAAPTLFVDSVAGLRRLPPELAARLAGARAVNVTYYFWGQTSDRPARSITPERPEAPRATHPVIWRHPVSGERFLYITELHTHHIEGLPLEESDQLLAEAHKALYPPQAIYEHRWRPGDLLVWDNRAAQHARGDVPDSRADPSAPERRLRRVAVGPVNFRDQVKLESLGVG
jgi:taurine dioxygenase